MITGRFLHDPGDTVHDALAFWNESLSKGYQTISMQEECKIGTLYTEENTLAEKI